MHSSQSWDQAAVHAMWELFTAEELEGLLLVATSNTFNALDKPAALWNCHCSWFLFNSYRVYAIILLKSLSPGKLVACIVESGGYHPRLLTSNADVCSRSPLAAHLKDPKQHKQNGIQMT